MFNFFKKIKKWNDKKPAQNLKVYDIKIIPDKSTISFKKKNLEITKEKIFEFLYKFKFLILGALIIILFLNYYFVYFRSRAEISVFYPKSCLGGWQNPQNATGKPDLDNKSKIEDFNENNSAVLKNIISEIYCGNFDGNIIENTKPQKAILKFSWAILEGERINQNLNIIETSTLIQINYLSTSTNTSTEEIITQTATEENINQNTASSSFLEQVENSSSGNQYPIQNSSDENQNNLNLENSTNINQIQVPASGNNSLPQEEPQEFPPTSFLNKLFNFVFAQDLENLDASTSIVTGELNSKISAASSAATFSESIFNNSTFTESTSEKNIISTDFISSSTENNSPSLEKDNIFEILYTFDGLNWISLGKVNFSNWQNLEFEIPDFNWSNLENFQVKIQSLSPKEFNLTAYLDGLILEVEYKTKENLNLDENRNLAQINETNSNNLSIELNNSSTNSINLNNENKDSSTTENLSIEYLEQEYLEQEYLELEQEYLEEESFEDNTLNKHEDNTLNKHKPNLDIVLLTKRRIQSNVILSKNSNVLCNFDSQSIDISNKNNTTLRFSVRNLKLNNKIEIGSLPDGIDIKFLKNNDYIINNGLQDEDFNLIIFNQSGSQKGNFNIPIIIYEDDTKGIICQINIINF